ncbi:MAG TPA: hypothetical protein VLY85_00320 [Thermoplasmata archaeon]|nr:hypothetical protein [Thermoplasmata archaeon]
MENVRSGVEGMRRPRVRFPTMSETGTRGPASSTAQIDTMSAARAARTDRPPVRSIRTTLARSSSPGTEAPTSMRVRAGSRRFDARERGPEETITRISTVGGSADRNGCVHRHSRQRAIPEIDRPDDAPVPRSTRRIRCSVSRPQFSHRRVAEWIWAEAGGRRARSGLGAPSDGAAAPSGEGDPGGAPVAGLMAPRRARPDGAARI